MEQGLFFSLACFLLFCCFIVVACIYIALPLGMSKKSKRIEMMKDEKLRLLPSTVLAAHLYSHSQVLCVLSCKIPVIGKQVLSSPVFTSLAILEE